MKNTFFYIFVFTLITVCSCKQAELPDYVNEPGLYFFREPGIYIDRGIQRDSLTFMFLAKQTPVGGIYEQELDIRTVGMPEDRERPFRIVQSNAGEPGAAVAGVHFVPFDDPRMLERLVIPADSVRHKFPIMCINAPSLTDEPVRLEVQIAENENFVQGIEAQSTFVINFAEVMKPDTWVDYRDEQSWYYYFGVWSMEKMKYISETVGIYDFDLEYEESSTARKRSYAMRMYYTLRMYNEANPLDPKLDENKEEITFPERFAN